MCTGLEMIIPALLSAGGAAITSSEAQANQQREVDARNQALQRTMAENSPIAKQARGEADQRIAQTDPAAVQKQQADATASRTAADSAVLTPPITPGQANPIPISGDAPQQVKSAIAGKMLDVFNQGKARAQAMGKLGGFGDTLFGQNMMSADLAPKISMADNFTRGNLGILPAQQDIEQNNAYRPISPLGGLLSGLGSMFGKMGGGGYYGG